MHIEGFYVENITLTLTANVPNNKVHNTLALANPFPIDYD